MRVWGAEPMGVTLFLAIMLEAAIMAAQPELQRAEVEQRPDAIVLTGGDLRCKLDKETGRILELTHLPAGDVFVSPRSGPGGLEVFDERDRKWYSDLQTACTLKEVIVSGREVCFVKQFEGAPFVLRCSWRAGGDGIRLHVEAALRGGGENRSVRVSVVLPVTRGLLSWAPSYPPPSDVLQNPVSYCYLADEQGKARTGIPMLTLMHPGKGGISLVMPFEVPKVQLNMGVEPYDPTPWYVPERIGRMNAGVEVDTISPPGAGELGDRPVIRFTEKHVGLRPGKVLPFAMWLFAHEPDWRPALGKVVQTYADYFEPHPAFRSLFGPRYGANPSNVADEKIAALRRYGVTHCWFHGHFEFHGEFLTDEAVSRSDYKWVCEPYPDRFRDLCVARIRDAIVRLKAAGIGTFLYGFNMHCDPTIIEKRNLQADVARNEDGGIARAYHDQPVMFFSPQSPFGAQILGQMDRMLSKYPEIIGIGLDNWNYAGIDFGHDDGITMVNNKPAANLNFSQQRMIPAIAAKMHGSGRFVMTNKGRTIESMRGVDAVGTEARGAETYAIFAYMNLCRCVTPTEYKARDDPEYAEYVLKYLLVWGGQMGTHEREADLDQARAYQGLFDLLRNRRWVFSPDPLTLPEGCQGQIFRIDPRSPWHPGDVVVTLVRPEIRWRDGKFKEGLALRIRLPDAGRFTKAWWLGAEGSADGPVPCELSRSGKELSIALPPVGCAGVLRLE